MTLEAVPDDGDAKAMAEAGIEIDGEVPAYGSEELAELEEEAPAAPTSTAIRTGLRARARMAFRRLGSERWAKVTIHDFLICPDCGALVYDLAGKIIHQAMHGRDPRGPSMQLLATELQELVQEIRDFLDEET